MSRVSGRSSFSGCVARGTYMYVLLATVVVAKECELHADRSFVFTSHVSTKNTTHSFTLEPRWCITVIDQTETLLQDSLQNNSNNETNVWHILSKEEQH